MSYKFTHSVKLFSMVMMFLSLGIFAQTKQQEQQIISRYDLIELEKIKSEFKAKEAFNKSSVLAYVKEKNVQSKITLADGGIAELQRIDPDGTAIYYRTFNVDAALSTRTNHLNTGGSLGLNLMGLNLRAHVWDGGIARASHQEYHGAGGSNRFTVGDSSTTLNFHAAHVTGTIMASGVVASAKGMAPHCRVTGYDWNSDLSEATTAASNGMLVSNHSYGYRSINSNGTFALPSYYPGAYITDSRNWDNLLRNAPFYLMVVAAGNDGNQAITTSPLMAGYDKLTGHATAKNNLVVANAQDANVATNGNLISVAINSSSSQGPTDDLRIKPDITGNGTGVYSTYESSNTAYASISGTSMASPNVTGSLLLLQEHYNNLNGNFMRAATLKGLVLHTADDAGPVGPDAIWGWGLLNSKRAAEAISQRNTFSIINEQTISQGQTITLQVTSNGASPLQASISWTDLPGTATTDLNSNTPRLVNDLDIRVSKDGVTTFPWRLTAANANGLGDNIRDPFERIDVNNASGTYTITITHKGTLSGGSQNFSLIVTGIAQNVACNATTPTNLNVGAVGSNNASLTWGAVSNATYQVQYRVVGSSTWTSVNSASNAITLTGLTPSTNYEAQVRSVCPNATTSAFTSSVNFSTTEAQLEYCASNGNSTVDEYISRVQFNTINNVSGAGTGGYSNFTNLSTTVNKGTAYTLTVTPTWTGTVYPEGYAAWIDYNKNGTFESNELVWSQTATNATPVSGSFTIPTTATDGPTRMRISMKYNGVPTACESFPYGEVEDYMVNIAPESDTQAPTAPTNLVTSNITQTTLTLNWTASTDNVGVTGYDVYRNGTLMGSSTSTSYNDIGLTASTTYSFYVRAKDAAGNISGNSNTVSVTTLAALDTQAPSNPTNLAASNITQTTLALNWTASTDNVGVTGYDVYMNNTLLGTVSSNAANISGLTASTTYQFYVRAKDAAGNVSGNSNTISATTLAPPDTQAPSNPTNLAASNIAQTTLTLNWTASTDNVGVTGYDVYMNNALLGTVSTNTANITGLVASTTYSFFVRAKDAAGNVSGNSNTISVNTLANALTYCTSRGNSTADEWINRVQLGSINNTSGANGGYADFTNLSTNLVRGGSSNTITIVPGRRAGTNFRIAYRVWIDYNQNGVFDSNELVFNSNRNTLTSVSGSFTVPTGALTGPTRMRVSAKYNASPTACEIFAHGEVEDYTVNITNANGTTSFEEVPEGISKISLYPNPTESQIFFSSSNQIKQIEIYNTLGQNVYVSKSVDQIDVSNFANGLYIVKLTLTDESEQVIKFSKK